MVTLAGITDAAMTGREGVVTRLMVPRAPKEVFVMSLLVLYLDRWMRI